MPECFTSLCLWYFTSPNVSASDVIDEEEADIPLVEADYEYFAKPGRDFDFLKLEYVISSSFRSTDTQHIDT